MAPAAKPEITLEVNSGSFRIPTKDAIYHIIVPGTGETSANRIVDQIVKNETAAARYESMAAPGVGAAPGDDFYKEISNEVFHDIGILAKSLSSTMMDIPAEDRKEKRAELDEAGEKIENAKTRLKDIMSMTENATMEILDQVEKVQSQTLDVKDLLSCLKDHKAFSALEAGEVDEPVGPDLPGEIRKAGEIVSAIKDKIGQMKEAAAAAGPAAVPGQPAEAEPAPAGKRYLFKLDTVFQTLYELCTNEAVKEHITKARERAAEIFDYDLFVDKISEVAPGLVEEDGFFQVPLADILTSMTLACSDKGVKNLFKNMSAKYETIFLDKSLPLEVPEIEESQTAIPEPVNGDDGAGGGSLDAAESDFDELSVLAAQGLEALNELAVKSENLPLAAGQASMSQMSLDDQADIFQKIEDAFGRASSISVDTSKITEVLSFQDLSGQQIMKIIKMLTDFQIQLLGLVVSFGSQLKHKEQNAGISIEESKRLAQDDVDSYINNLKPSVEKEDGGMLDQETVNSMLEDFGF